MEKETITDIIIFDGECNLCNGVVGWLLKFAPQNLFHFTPFQSPIGQQLLKAYGFPTSELDTVILIDADGPKTHSDGFLKIVSKIPKYRYVAAVLAFIPKLIRDGIYKIASRNRIKWFGRSKTCTINF
ncbi:Predicted thiol-disulfide oxidoreductase YuxK, DCC family [Hyunsoonleella jejuensis]|uniref:Predicted thiol-disulfide oxidoreductase YuxK, DCC family n=1 Tax=Hyunsoonleella jejuensis TaxID=419940 RepID=A0A1H9JN39_9FLAO|nr:DUF393 domain-containing protein [Hyunsoonleella jejuensis]SEQ88351.1 Predicted thiol-disulfide oxidoreductase YuxK, DCC family [Hyunsoonleella jejuensis]